MRHSDGSTTRYENGKGGDHTYSHHDANGKLVEDSRFNGDGSGEARHFYEDGSQQTVRRDKDGSSHTFTYDKDGNLSTYEASWANGVKENFRANPDNSTYYSKKDPSGRMEEESLIKQDGTGERRLYPAEGGRIEQSWDKDVTTTTAYDKNGQRVN